MTNSIPSEHVNSVQITLTKFLKDHLPGVRDNDTITHREYLWFMTLLKMEWIEVRKAVPTVFNGESVALS